MKELTEYLFSPSENIILECGQTTNANSIKKLKDLVLVQLNELYLRSVGQLQHCFSLKVCILSNIYITNIDPLVCCVHLVKLDLHGNQEATFVEAINWVKDIISKINHVLAHHTPILIVQRWIRGYLTRKKNGKILLHEVPLQRHYIRDGAKQIYSQGTPSECDSKSFMYHIIKPEQNTEDEKLTSGKQVFSMDNFKELPVLCLGREKQAVISILPTLGKKERKIKLEERRIPLRKGSLDMEKPNMEEQVENKFKLSVGRAIFYPVRAKLPLFQKQGEEIWHAVHGFHSGIHPNCQSKAMHCPSRIEKRIFAKMYGSGMRGPLYDIDTFYKESKQHDIQTRKEFRVMQMKNAKDKVKHNVEGFLREKKHGAQIRCKEDDKRIQGALRQREVRRSKYIEDVREGHAQFLEKKKQKASEYSFVQEFSTQHVALTQSFSKLDRMKKCKESVKEKERIVTECKEKVKKCKELIKSLQEQRKSMLQKQSLAEKKFIESIFFQNTTERLQKAKARVEAAKEQQSKIMCRVPLNLSVCCMDYIVNANV
ncbi:PREDICTED: leucine-rich repeat and IQ domain-containing protein 3 [Gavialis gangeticus]|uniref:leucine-rich repeat and IQ domain-containing protein 3 n=1 Tax=Gavialis gangeticus TaxID=94835 RepID=UPI00092E253B|nr:PREDICTED: leucine-rich repeat and IQ domain-containing protein 3 [Gavialis gangeticus]